jgi:hypothetical protein
MDPSNPDLLELIWHAWQTRVKPLIDKDPDELVRRLARRRSGMMQRPPRAWCLAVRASDHRINPATALCVSEDAAYPPATRGYGREVFAEHEVTLDARLVRQLVRPIFIAKPGFDQAELAKMLGCTPQNLAYAVRRGVFRVHHVRGLGGKWCKPIPVLYTDRPIDPGRQSWQQDDPLWGTMWKYLCERVPDDLCQTLTRVPAIADFGSRKPRRCGPEGPTFTGWRWLCPSCRKRCRTIFYPLPPVHGLKLLDRDVPPRGAPGGWDDNDPDARAEPLRTFACTRCHNVLYFTRFDAEKWNHLISHLTGGLMFGRDVPRPSWYVQRRTRPFRPQLHRRPSRRRAEILAALRRGLTIKQIALHLRTSAAAGYMHARELYRQHGVKNQAALRAKLASEDRHARQEIRMNSNRA